MYDGNNNSPHTDKEETLADRCSVVSDIEDLKLLYDLTTDQALEVLKIYEMRRHREVMHRTSKTLNHMSPQIVKMASKLSNYVGYKYEGLEPHHTY